MTLLDPYYYRQHSYKKNISKNKGLNIFSNLFMPLLIQGDLILTNLHSTHCYVLFCWTYMKKIWAHKDM